MRRSGPVSETDENKCNAFALLFTACLTNVNLVRLLRKPTVKQLTQAITRKTALSRFPAAFRRFLQLFYGCTCLSAAISRRSQSLPVAVDSFVSGRLRPGACVFVCSAPQTVGAVDAARVTRTSHESVWSALPKLLGCVYCGQR